MARTPGKQNKVCNIPEDDFWRSLRVPATAHAKSDLRKAIQLGRAGSKSKAYQALNEYYRQASLDTWRSMREAEREAPNRKVLNDMFKGKVTVGHGSQFHFTKGVDFSSLACGVDARHWLQGVGWCRPMLDHLVATGDPRARAFFVGPGAGVSPFAKIGGRPWRRTESLCVWATWLQGGGAFL